MKKMNTKVGGWILMPNWNDEAIILNVKEFGETSLLLTLFSKEHGKWSGLLKNSNNQSQKAVLQPGNIIKAEWYARVDEQLGTFRIIEIINSFLAKLISNPKNLKLTANALLVTNKYLIDREPAENIYSQLVYFINNISPQNEVYYKITMLKELGYGLDLTKCAVTGEQNNLTYISPKTGRAVSEKAGGIYKEKLFILPEFLINHNIIANENDIENAKNITDYFLKKWCS